MRSDIFTDLRANRGNFKGQFVLVLFRLAVVIRNNKLCLVLFFWYLLLYRLFVEWVLGIELSWNIKAGRRLKLYHGQSLIVYSDTVIGDDCTLRHSTTLGNKQLPDGSYTAGPVIGNNVDIGAHVCIIGDIKVGDNVKIGAGSVVVKDVPSDCTVMGNPACIIKTVDRIL